MKLIKLSDDIIFLDFKDSQSAAKALIRFQEHFESPKFRGKIFSLKEYKEWYMKERKSDVFTYYTDWKGFNFPGITLKKFYDGTFKKISRKEEEILCLLKDYDLNKLYILGGCFKDKGVLSHELSHALFFSNKEYRDLVLLSLNDYDLEEEYEILKAKGYHKDVLDDEVHAYILDDYFDNTSTDLYLRLSYLYNMTID